MKDLKNKVAFITGGNKGIGFGIAESLVQEGMKVAISSRSQAAADEAAQAIMSKHGGEVFGLEMEVKDYAAQERAVQAIMDKWGSLDCLIANAGIGHFAPIDQMAIEAWDAVIDTNVNGLFYSIRASAEALKASKGYIFTISSLAGTNFFANGSAYNASKFAVTGLSQAAMLDFRPYDVKVTTIMPGSVTSYFNGHEPNAQDAWKIQPEDLGELIVDLLKIHPRTLASKVEVRPSRPPGS